MNVPGHNDNRSGWNPVDREGPAGLQLQPQSVKNSLSTTKEARSSCWPRSFSGMEQPDRHVAKGDLLLLENND
jgi:hypothetical protein